MIITYIANCCAEAHTCTHIHTHFNFLLPMPRYPLTLKKTAYSLFGDRRFLMVVVHRMVFFVVYDTKIKSHNGICVHALFLSIFYCVQ